MTEVRHVVPAPSGGWLVVEDAQGRPAEPGQGRRKDGVAPHHFERKREAAAYAKDLVRELGGGEVMLHAPSGRIVEVDTVTPDNPAVSLQ